MPVDGYAVWIEATGGSDVLRCQAQSVADPGPGQLLVRTGAAGVNFIDTYQRSGLYPLPLPAVLGMEGAGEVIAVGPDVEDFGVGQRVAWLDVMGSYATHVLVPAARAVAVPEAVSTHDAAAIMLQGGTAHYLVNDTFALGAGHTALVHAAAGGVGLLLCQLAHRTGARVIGTTGTAEKAELARAAGADDVIVYRDQDWVSAVRELTGGRGVDVVYDGVGRSTFLGGLDVLRPRGVMASFGNASGPVDPISPLLLSQKGSLFLTRPTLAHHVASTQELRGRVEALLGALAQGHLTIRIGERIPLAEAARAHDLLQSRATTGKVLLLP